MICHSAMSHSDQINDDVRWGCCDIGLQKACLPPSRLAWSKQFDGSVMQNMRVGLFEFDVYDRCSSVRSSVV